MWSSLHQLIPSRVPTLGVRPHSRLVVEHYTAAESCKSPIDFWWVVVDWSVWMRGRGFHCESWKNANLCVSGAFSNKNPNGRDFGCRDRGQDLKLIQRFVETFGLLKSWNLIKIQNWKKHFSRISQRAKSIRPWEIWKKFNSGILWLLKFQKSNFQCFHPDTFFLNVVSVKGWYQSKRNFDLFSLN